MYNIPNKKEYLEALQEKVNEQRKALMQKLSGDQKKKYEILEKCVAELDGADIPFFLFGVMPIEKGDEKIVMGPIQYNSFAKHIEFDESERIKSLDDQKYTRMILANIFRDFCYFPYNRSVNSGEMTSTDACMLFLDNCHKAFQEFYIDQKY